MRILSPQNKTDLPTKLEKKHKNTKRSQTDLGLMAERLN